MSAFGEFTFKMREALIDQVMDFLSEKQWAPLIDTVIEAEIGEYSRSNLGVYLLGKIINPPVAGVPEDAIQRLPDGRFCKVIYVGQSQDTIFSRLMKHARFVQDRHELSNGEIMFKAAEVIIFDSVGIETKLIERYATRWNDDFPQSCGWNFSGFGSNDSGGGRDGQKASKFDLLWPIKLDTNRSGIFKRDGRGRDFRKTIKKAIRTLSDSVPYTVRIHKDHRDHEDLNAMIAMPDIPMTAYQAIVDILAGLPREWEARVYPVKVVFHRGHTPDAVQVDPNVWPPNFDAQHPFAVIRRTP